MVFLARPFRKMKIKLIKGSFSDSESPSLLREMLLINVKIHKRKIQNTHFEEDIKMGESKIV